MASEPTDLLEWASETLDSGGKSEVCWRACASRAYYAAYHYVAWIGTEMPAAPANRGGVHDQLCWQLQSAPRPENWRASSIKLRQIGYILQQQKDIRVKADYALSDDFVESDAQEAIKHADRVREILSEVEPKSASSSSEN